MNKKILAENKKPKDVTLPIWVSLILLGLLPFYGLYVLYQDGKEYLKRSKDDDN